jgi:hypothetical protein
MVDTKVMIISFKKELAFVTVCTTCRKTILITNIKNACQSWRQDIFILTYHGRARYLT